MLTHNDAVKNIQKAVELRDGATASLNSGEIVLHMCDDGLYYVTVVPPSRKVSVETLIKLRNILNARFPTG